jgi:hypothetical protein
MNYRIRQLTIGGSLLALFLFNACDGLLDREYVMESTEEEIIREYSIAQGRVNELYTCLPNGFTYIGSAMMASASDEAEETGETAEIQKFNTGAWGPLDNPNSFAWGINFQGIRGANLILATIDSVYLDHIKNDPTKETEYKEKEENRQRWVYEVRFLRAFFYFELVKRYGGVPVLTEALDLNTDFAGIPRQSLADCIEFIVDECDSTANYLPAKYANPSHWGRATKGAALALKSRVLLYAASDLFNDPSWADGYSNPELIALPAADRNARWKAAADAAKAVIDLTDAGYALATDFTGLFKTYNNNEIIFTRRFGEDNTFEKNNYPIGYDLGWSGTTPSQNLVDAFEMKDGTPFNWENPAHAADPYADRDPRLAYSVLLNNTVFNGRRVEIWTGGRDGKGKPLATRTGYYLYKYINPDLDLLQNQTRVHTWILMRLPEIYLNYAEALNEYDPGNPDSRTYIDKIRERTGVGMPKLPDNLTQTEMRERIRNERRVELAFEDHRFWDVRRWKIADKTLNVPLRGVEITRTATNAFDYKVIHVENRVFENRMYFYPIPQNEINVAKWAQNPLW